VGWEASLKVSRSSQCRRKVNYDWEQTLRGSRGVWKLNSGVKIAIQGWGRGGQKLLGMNRVYELKLARWVVRNSKGSEEFGISVKFQPLADKWGKLGQLQKRGYRRDWERVGNRPS